MGEGLVIKPPMKNRGTQWRASAIVKEMAKQNRKKPTEAEKALWAMLRDERCDGYKFRRQAPIGPFVADFSCPKVKLIVEADGGVHDDEAQARRDAERDEILQTVYGYRILRIPNGVILCNPEDALSRIKAALTEQTN